MLKGQRSIMDMVSLLLKFAPGRFLLSLAVMGGVKILSHILWASLAVSSKGASSSKVVHNPWFKLNKVRRSSTGFILQVE